MFKHSLRAATAVAAATLTTVALATPASAVTRYFADQPDDTGIAGDITLVKVANSSAGNTRIGVRAQVGQFSPGDEFTVFLDTRRSDPGPEYKVSMIANSDAFGLVRVESFRDRGTPKPCPGLRATADGTTDSEEIAISVPRSCVGSPRTVRVSLQARYQNTAEEVVVDWAPAKHRFFRAVSR